MSPGTCWPLARESLFLGRGSSTLVRMSSRKGVSRDADAAPHGAQVALGGANCQILDEGLLQECPDLPLEVNDGSSNNILCTPKTSNQTRSLFSMRKTVIEMKILSAKQIYTVVFSFHDALFTCISLSNAMIKC